MKNNNLPEVIEVDAKLLATLLAQNTELKEQNQRFKNMLAGAMQIQQIVSDEIFGGIMPDKFTKVDAIKAVTKLPKLLDKLKTLDIAKIVGFTELKQIAELGDNPQKLIS
jgi:hypothetical protein